MFAPIGVAVSSGGQVYFSDAFNHRIRKLDNPPLAIETTALPRGGIGNAYHAQLEAAGGAAPYTWSVTGLPAGLHCSSSGVISGTPEQPGSFQFMSEYTVQVAVEDAAGALDSKTLSLKVYAGTGNGAYIVTPEADPAYTGGLTADGIVTLTVNSGVSGFTYFTVSVAPVTGHAGNEVLIFVHRRGGKQIGISTVKADFDAADLIAGASFNVRPGDVIKVYLVDDLTNDPGVNPVVL